MSVALVTTTDVPLLQVYKSLEVYSRLSERIAGALRKAFDEVIDGPRTGRYQIQELEKTEKTYIGTKVEIVLRSELELQRGEKLDNVIAGYEVDTKFSLDGKWMIPREAMGEICLLISGNDDAGRFSVGLLRMTSEVLCNGENRDGKKSVSAIGKSNILWLVREGTLPPNFMLRLDEHVRQRILGPAHGTMRVRELFRNVTNKVIPRHVLEQVAQQKDPLKRARQVKRELIKEGFSVVCAKSRDDCERFRRIGYNDIRKDDWISFKGSVP